MVNHSPWLLAVRNTGPGKTRLASYSFFLFPPSSPILTFIPLSLQASSLWYVLGMHHDQYCVINLAYFLIFCHSLHTTLWRAPALLYMDFVCCFFLPHNISQCPSTFVFLSIPLRMGMQVVFNSPPSCIHQKLKGKRP